MYIDKLTAKYVDCQETFGPTNETLGFVALLDDDAILKGLFLKSNGLQAQFHTAEKDPPRFLKLHMYLFAVGLSKSLAFSAVSSPPLVRCMALFGSLGNLGRIWIWILNLYFGWYGV